MRRMQALSSGNEQRDVIFGARCHGGFLRGRQALGISVSNNVFAFEVPAAAKRRVSFANLLNHHECCYVVTDTRVSCCAVREGL